MDPVLERVIAVVAGAALLVGIATGWIAAFAVTVLLSGTYATLRVRRGQSGLSGGRVFEEREDLSRELAESFKDERR
jgi:uncharacterized membrane protein YphA (DoxX/SURF4 family)